MAVAMDNRWMRRTTARAEAAAACPAQWFGAAATMPHKSGSSGGRCDMVTPRTQMARWVSLAGAVVLALGSALPALGQTANVLGVVPEGVVIDAAAFPAADRERRGGRVQSEGPDHLAPRPAVRTSLAADAWRSIAAAQRSGLSMSRSLPGPAPSCSGQSIYWPCCSGPPAQCRRLRATPAQRRGGSADARASVRGQTG